MGFGYSCDSNCKKKYQNVPQTASKHRTNKTKPSAMARAPPKPPADEENPRKGGADIGIDAGRARPLIFSGGDFQVHF